MSFVLPQAVGVSYVLRMKQEFPQSTLVSGVLQKSVRHTYIHTYIPIIILITLIVMFVYSY